MQRHTNFEYIPTYRISAHMHLLAEYDKDFQASMNKYSPKDKKGSSKLLRGKGTLSSAVTGRGKKFPVIMVTAEIKNKD